MEFSILVTSWVVVESSKGVSVSDVVAELQVVIISDVFWLGDEAIESEELIDIWMRVDSDVMDVEVVSDKAVISNVVGEPKIVVDSDAVVVFREVAGSDVVTTVVMIVEWSFVVNCDVIVVIIVGDVFFAMNTNMISEYARKF